MPNKPLSSFPGWIVPTGAMFALLAVAAGAFGAHGLKARLDVNALQSWETAARYQMYHALGLLLLGGLSAHVRPCGIQGSAICFTAGMIIFSGSLYALSLSGIRWLGAITPVGGSLLLTGWMILGINAILNQRTSRLP